LKSGVFQSLPLHPKFSLLKNKNTIGVHFTGNFGYIDNMGFLVIKENRLGIIFMHMIWSMRF
jgi:hypothetical protein